MTRSQLDTRLLHAAATTLLTGGAIQGDNGRNGRSGGRVLRDGILTVWALPVRRWGEEGDLLLRATAAAAEAVCRDLARVLTCAALRATSATGIHAVSKESGKDDDDSKYNDNNDGDFAWTRAVAEEEDKHRESSHQSH